MTSPATPLMIAATIDVSDLEAASRFWSELLEVELLGIHEPFAFLGTAEGRKISIWLQLVDEEKAGKNRCHLDFVASDLEAAEKKVVALGGSLGDRSSWQQYKWRTCLDPDGNEFDIMQAEHAQ